ncbi:MAG: DUF2723 domain-containing protein [Chloroflexi bacterium]|nr:DUF2723 domain-containing protein [Chloroflexota bacterium]
MKIYRFQQWLPWFVWAGYLLLYSATAAPSIVELFDDSLEFQLVGPTFGIAHPTGYPLYSLLGGLWSRVIFPFGNWAWRMNLFSALAAATTVLLVFLLARRLVTDNQGQPNLWAALAATLAFGLGPVWWLQATVAEVYALHGLFVAAILSITIGMNQTFKPESTSALSRMALLCTMIGLGLTHHRTTVLLLPGLLIYLLWSVPGLWRPRSRWLLWIIALLAPLLFYLYIPLRAAMGAVDLHHSYQNTWSGFWNHVLATGYSASFFKDNPLAKHYTVSGWLQLFRQQVGWFGLLLGILGLAWLFDRRKKPAKAWILILLVFLTNLVFAFNYKVSDVEVFLLPTFLCLALLIGGGVGLLGRWLAPNPRVAGSVQALCILLIGAGVGGRGTFINRSQVWAAHDYAVALAKVNFPPHSQMIALEGEATALQYMQQAEGLGLNATAVIADDQNMRQQAIASAVMQGKPTYITRELKGIESRYSFSGDGPLVRVWPRGQAQVGNPQQALDLAMADGRLKLEGVDLDVPMEAQGPAVRVAFYWRPVAQLTQTFKLSLRLQQLDGTPLHWPDGKEVTEDQFPLHQAAGTQQWVVGERIRDEYTLHMPTTSRGQPIRLQVIVYDAETVAEVGRWQTDLSW